MKLTKLMVLFASCLCFSLFANERKRSDAVVLTTKSFVKTPTSTNSIDTGITIENGDVWLTGYRDAGISGSGPLAYSHLKPPYRVEFFVEKGLNITQITAGAYHQIALDDHGDVWAWGDNRAWQASAIKAGNLGAYQTIPTLVLEGKDVIMTNAGEYTSFALTRSGEVYAWGTSAYGQMANGSQAIVRTVLHRIPQSYFHDSPVVLIGAGYESAWAINERGEVFAWGDDESNQYGFRHSIRGIPVHVYQTYPVQITNLPPGISGGDIVTITGGNRYTAFLTSEGEVWAMGAANHLGIGFGYLGSEKKTPLMYEVDKNGNQYKVDNELDVADPQFVMDNVNTLYCRYGGCCAITNDGELYTWGVTVAANDRHNWQIMYGYMPIKRDIIGNLTKIDGGKENLIYWNDEGQAFGVGWNNWNKYYSSVNPVKWPGVEIKELPKAMKEVYGKDFVPGQG
ncbi:MAG: hypothetical protein J6572_06505 [Gilliamella sp.]|nr:hypothetical protein [Gilliamella sp.]